MRITALLSLSVLPVVGLCAVASQPPAPEKVDFNRDVRPILAGHCFKCHGPDDKQRQAHLRLDTREGALAVLKDGKRAVQPSSPDQSELVHRILASGPLQMPPPTANKPLTDRERWILRRWVADGARYDPHWAFVGPKRAAMPKVHLASWPRNPIDYFALARMESAGLKPSPEADRYTLCRRLYLDLVGIPPTPEQADEFAHDGRPDAYERLVDGLLASPHYGEKWARRWLDLARYADTNGFEKDRPRSIWPYRDWVINALNGDMPFDQFTVKQLAGDMLPDATVEDRVATGFHRNTMLNEEGGIDPLEYRYYSMVDRTNVTGTTWLGLTVGCAQCHTHKFDPITQREYYRLLACLDNAEEPEMEIPRPDLVAKRAKIEAEAADREAHLADKFPPLRSASWLPPENVKVVSATTESGATIHAQSDGSLLVSGVNPEADTYTVVLESPGVDISAARIEALADPTLGGGGPGRTPHGNFVLTEVSATVGATGGPAAPVKLVDATTDFTQSEFSAAATLDSNPRTGWAIDGPGTLGKDHAITYRIANPARLAGPARWTFRLAHAYGGHHTLGRFRISLGAESRELLSGPAHLKQAFGEWLAAKERKAVRWTVLRPVKATSNLPLLTIQPDNSIFVSGDEAKREVYDVDFGTDLRGITAVRLEVLPDDRLPNHGPGRVYYEGAPGDFFLSEAAVLTAGAPQKIARAAASFGSTPQAMLDGDPQTAWTINGGQGKPHSAVFNLAKPLESGAFSLRLLFERYHAADLGRFRVSATTDPRPAEAGLPPDVESALLVPATARTAAQSGLLLSFFLSTAPELSGEREAIRKLRDSEPAFPTTLVFRERSPDNPRQTFVHHRGEFLQATERVEPGTLSILPPTAVGAKLDRLAFARWLVSPDNPLTARVTVNRQWQAFFGQGIVRTLQDFGYTGDAPTHPQLLDWLATELVRNNWSMKKLHRLIVMSATYRQSSRITPELIRSDPENRLLARGPRVRLEAELIRDSALAEGGLLSGRIGGPSVFPPQPAGVTSEGTYGPLAWKVSEGEDRYRRGLYTFAKRTAPYAMFTTFDGPTGEAICPRREVSNTPLQALALLNDQVLVEAAQALGRMISARPGNNEAKAIYLFRRCLTRPPSPSEIALLTAFYAKQHERFATKQLDARAVGGEGEGDPVERASWTATARSILNLDEAIVKQ